METLIVKDATNVALIARV